MAFEPNAQAIPFENNSRMWFVQVVCFVCVCIKYMSIFFFLSDKSPHMRWRKKRPLPLQHLFTSVSVFVRLCVCVCVSECSVMITKINTPKLRTVKLKWKWMKTNMLMRLRQSFVAIFSVAYYQHFTVSAPYVCVHVHLFCFSVFFCIYASLVSLSHFETYAFSC